MSSLPLAQGVGGAVELCHLRFLRQHHHPVLRHAALLSRPPRSHRQSHWLRETPGERTLQYVQLFFPLRFVTLSPPVCLRGIVSAFLFSDSFLSASTGQALPVASAKAQALSSQRAALVL